MLHIYFVSYDKQTFQNVHLHVDDNTVLDMIDIFLFFVEIKYFVTF